MMGMAYAGLTLVIFVPELEATNSLLMKRPVGNVMSRPFGALSCVWRAMLCIYRGRKMKSRG